MAIASDIFRAYDVRGVYPDDIDADVARTVGNAAARYLRGRTFVVGEDGRTSSPELRAGVVEGITAAGCDVVTLGRCTTPLFYYAVHALGADGGIMVTASHNPREYNGLKVVRRGGIPVGLGSGLESIQELAEAGDESVGVAGRVSERRDIVGQYVNFIIREAGVKPGSITLPVVADAGNGVAGTILVPLFERLRIPLVPLRFRIDGTFPERSPNPTVPGALADLSRAVVREGAPLGFAFDGDADRLTVVDEQGKLVPAQFILAFLWRATKRWWRTPKVVYDLRFSRAVREVFGHAGVRSRAGRSNIGATMLIEHAALGGETSGHLYFREMHNLESPELAALKLLQYLQRAGAPLSTLAAPLEKYAYSDEVNVPLDGVPQQLAFLRALRDRYRDGRQDELDGLTVEYPGWWFNVRPSHTEPVMRLVVEALTPELMEEKLREIGAIAEYVS